jgi:hypothetical protein
MMNNVFFAIAHLFVSVIATSKSFLEHSIVLLGLTSISLSLKLFISYRLFLSRPTSALHKKNWGLLLIVLGCALLEDISWIVKLVHSIYFPSMSYTIVRFIIRMAWATLLVRYTAFALFIQHPWTKPTCTRFIQKCCILIATVISVTLCTWALCYPFYDTGTSPMVRALIRCIILFAECINISVIIWYIFSFRKHFTGPRIIKDQIGALMSTFVIPTSIMEFIQAFPFDLQITTILVTNSYVIMSLSNMLLTYMTYYCASKMVNLRFLNIKDHVHSKKNFNFIDDFKEVLEQLGTATTMQEIAFITQEIFHKAFKVPLRATTLHACTYQQDKNKSAIATTVDTVLSSCDNQLSCAIHSKKILMYDETAFDNFYDKDEQSSSILAFLDNIGADICIPIFNQQKIIGCIIVERNARHELYCNVERDEMIVFAQYLGNIINLLQNRNLENIFASEKEMREELFSKHQEINQYKESMRTFLHNNRHTHIGIIFYKNRQFIFGNREAQDIVNVNLNVQIGHILAKACRQVVADVTNYQATRTIITHDDNGNKVVINGMPYLDRTHVILVLYYPEATDLIYKQIDQLKDPSEWDYLLYLETTKTGQLINQMIPGNGTNLLNFKIDLLKASLSSKVSLLDMPSEDLMPTVELLHHISLRNQLHTIILEKPQTTPDVTIRLFGLNPLFETPQEEPLLKRLDNNGTLFIQNIHFLNRETQDYLAEYIHYGFFRIYKSDQKILSNTRILCSSNQQLESLALEGRMSPLLLKELQKTKLVMPALNSMNESEIDDLAYGFFQQALADKTFEKILEFDKRDRKRIIDSRPTSILELKKRVQSFLTQKSRNNNICVEKTVDPGYQITDPELVKIARLGKHALKDEKAMTILWNKFKNQNKIATFLGVNRSSVNRRCKDYNLIF